MDTYVNVVGTRHIQTQIWWIFKLLLREKYNIVQSKLSHVVVNWEERRQNQPFRSEARFKVAGIMCQGSEDT